MVSSEKFSFLCLLRIQDKIEIDKITFWNIGKIFFFSCGISTDYKIEKY